MLLPGVARDLASLALGLLEQHQLTEAAAIFTHAVSTLEGAFGASQPELNPKPNPHPNLDPNPNPNPNPNQAPPSPSWRPSSRRSRRPSPPPQRRECRAREVAPATAPSVASTADPVRARLHLASTAPESPGLEPQTAR